MFWRSKKECKGCHLLQEEIRSLSKSLEKNVTWRVEIKENYQNKIREIEKEVVWWKEKAMNFKKNYQ